MTKKIKKDKDPSVDHTVAADEAKYRLRNDEDLNRAYPIPEKNPPLPLSPERKDQ